MPPLLDKNIKHCRKLMLQKNLDLQLSGSQINLASRPQTIKKVSTRSAKGVLIKRPMSATPGLGYTNRVKKSIPAWTRPQSADNCTGISRRNKLAARFNSLNTEEDQDLFRNLGETYTVSSTNLLQSLMGSSSIDVPLDSDISITPSPRLTKTNDVKNGIEEFSKDRSIEYQHFQESNANSKTRDKVKVEKSLKSDKGSSSSLVACLEPGLASKPPLPPTAEPKTMKYNLSSWNSLTEAEGASITTEEKGMNDDDIINLKFQRWFPDSVLNTSNYTSMDEERIRKVNIDMKHLFTNPKEEKLANTEVTDSESLAGSRNSLSEEELSEESGGKLEMRKNQKGEKVRKFISSSSSFSQGKEPVKVNKSSSVRGKRVSSKSFVRNKEKQKLNQSMSTSEKDLNRMSVDTGTSKVALLKNHKPVQKQKQNTDKISSTLCQSSTVKNTSDNFSEIVNRKSTNTDELKYKSGLHTSNESIPQFSFDYDLLRSVSLTRPSTSTTNFSNNESLLYNSSTPINCTEADRFLNENSAKQNYIHSVKDATMKNEGKESFSEMNSNPNIGTNDKTLVPSINVTDLSAKDESKSKDLPRLIDSGTKKSYLAVPIDASSFSDIDKSSSHLNSHNLNNYLNQSQSHCNRDNMNSPLQDNFFAQAEFSNGPVTSSSRSIVANFHHEEDGMRKFFQTRVAVSECLVETVQGESCKGVGQKIIQNNSVLNASSFEQYNSGIASDRRDEVECNAKHSELAESTNERYGLSEQSNSCTNKAASSTNNYSFLQSCHSSNSFTGLINQNVLSEKQTYRPQDFDVCKQKKHDVKDQTNHTKLNDINEIPERDNDYIGTYDDIVDILRVLEQEEGKQTTLNSNNSGSVTSINQRVDVLEGSNETSQAILSYLDEVNRNSEITLKRNPQQKSTNDKSIFQMDNRDSICGSGHGRLGELLSIPSPELAQCVMNLSLELEENIEAKKATEEQLVAVKSTFEKYKSDTKAALERHQKFIDQLINEKKQLSEKCANVVKDMECKQAQAIKVLEDRHAVELKKACEKQAATEKIKRERWIDLKTKKIKELTVKGLEPELNRMAAVHQEELSELRRAHQHQMEEAEAGASRRLASARMQFEADKEAALMQERDVMRRRLEHETTEMEKSYQDQRKRMINELRAEREQMQRENASIVLEKERELLQKLEKMTQESHEKYEQQEKRFQEELERMRNVVEAEKEAWLTRQKTLNSEKEKQIREELKRERDRHIEVAIRKLESEASGREEAAENKLKREKERFECELKDMENAHKDVRDKLKQARTDLSLAEQQNSRLASDLQQATGEIESLKLITEKLAKEKHELQLLGEEETRKRVSGLERELAQARLALREQMNTVQNEKERELQQVYARVREAITKKDDTINLMAKERDAALEQCAHLEKLMEQHRKEMIKRKTK